MPNNQQLSDIGVFMESPEQIEAKRQELLASALSKLSVLGLTEDEAKAVIGL